MLIVFLARYYENHPKRDLFIQKYACMQDDKKRPKDQHIETSLLSNQFDAELLHY